MLTPLALLAAHAVAGSAPQPGFVAQPLSTKAAAAAGVAQGMKVTGLSADCPAAVQLQKADVVFEIAGAPVRYPADLAALLKDHPVAVPLPVAFMRAGKEHRIQLGLCGAPVPAPAPVAAASSSAEGYASPILADGTVAAWAGPSAPPLEPGAEVEADHWFSNPCALGARLAALKDQPVFPGLLRAVNALHPDKEPEIAACIANPTPPVPSTVDPSTLGADIVSQLEKLKGMRDSGAISEAEYEAAKARLLGL